MRAIRNMKTGWVLCWWDEPDTEPDTEPEPERGGVYPVGESSSWEPVPGDGEELITLDTTMEEFSRRLEDKAGGEFAGAYVRDPAEAVAALSTPAWDTSAPTALSEVELEVVPAETESATDPIELLIERVQRRGGKQVTLADLKAIRDERSKHELTRRNTP